MATTESPCKYHTIRLECEAQRDMIVVSISAATVRELDLRYPQRYPHRPGGVGFTLPEGITNLTDHERRSLVYVLTKIPERELLGYVVEVKRGTWLLETWDFRKKN